MAEEKLVEGIREFSLPAEKDIEIWFGFSPERFGRGECLAKLIRDMAKCGEF